MEQESKHLDFKKRKEEHLRISLEENVQSKGVSTGLEKYFFIHQALPEIDRSEIDLSVSLFGKKLSAPILISAMVGGIESAIEINRNLAGAAQELGLGMGVGSQRCLIEAPETLKTFYVRDVAPDILLFANLGAVQLNYGFGVKECQSLIKIIEADALMLHLNPLQEALQPEGNTNFKGLVEKISRICRELPVPVIVKEVGCGISAEAAARLAEAGIAGIETGGGGGTSFNEIEGKRSSEEKRWIASEFSGWGIPTSDSILMIRKVAPGLPLIASGGIRSGLDIAKAVALGADAAGMAQPLLKPAGNSVREVKKVLEAHLEVLKTAMFCTGLKNIRELRNSGLLIKR